MNPVQIIVLIALPVFALWAGSIVARKSAEKKPVANGAGGVFHYLAACVASIIPLTVITSSFIFRTTFSTTATVCISLFVVEFALLSLYALFQTARKTAI